MNSNLLSDWLGYINSNRPNEEEFGLEIPDEEAENLATVGDAVKYIESNS